MDFFEQYKPFALQIQAETGVPAALILAQAALESNYGKSAPGNNFFGVKGTGPNGGQYLWTTEVYGGKPQRVQAVFRKYISPADSFRDHARLISTSPYYANVMKVAKSGDINAIAKAIGDSPYATDPQYGQKILSMMKKNKLEDLVPSKSTAEKAYDTIVNAIPSVNIAKPAMATDYGVGVARPSAQPATVAQTYKPQTYTVKAGDTPGQIAQQYLGDWNRWKEVWSGDPRKMPVGVQVNIPRPSSPSYSAPQPAPAPTPQQIQSGGQSSRGVFNQPTVRYQTPTYRPIPAPTPYRAPTPSRISPIISGAQSGRDIFGRPTTIYR